jgi:hypothetical protein
VTNDPKAELAAALADDDPDAALRALRWSLRWSARAAGAAAGEPEGAVAIRAVGLLDDALSEVDALAREAPGLVAAAQPGRAVEAYIEARRQELLELQADVARAQARFEELAQIEHELRDRAAEHQELRRRVQELRRLKLLVRALDGLQGKRHVLEDRIAELSAAVEEPDRAAAVGAARLLRLSQTQRAALSEEQHQVLDELEAVQTDLVDEEERLERDRAELADALHRYEQLRPQREQRLASLEIYAGIDRELADRLLALDLPDQAAGQSDLQQAHEVLDRVEQLLGQIDDALRHTLEAHERVRDQARQVLGWSDALEPTLG